MKKSESGIWSSPKIYFSHLSSRYFKSRCMNAHSFSFYMFIISHFHVLIYLKFVYDFGLSSNCLSVRPLTLIKKHRFERNWYKLIQFWMTRSLLSPLTKYIAVKFLLLGHWEFGYFRFIVKNWFQDILMTLYYFKQCEIDMYLSVFLKLTFRRI